MDTTSQVQIMDEIACVFLAANTIKKGKKPFLLLAVGK